VQRIARALEWARGAGVPVVHIVHESRRPDPKTFAPGSPTLAIHPSARRPRRARDDQAPARLVHRTGLEAFLRERGSSGCSSAAS
jgi:nicotinamidase-related amidase